MNQARTYTHLFQRFRSYRVNHKYKDRLFRYIFKDKKDLLELYNAINGTAYTDPSDLTITTLSDVIYLGMKNDVSFLVGNCMNLYEHQSTINPNMPLRGLIYMTELYHAYVETENYDVYSSKRIELPFPKYIVFYNGEDEAEDREEMCLSSAFPKIAGSLPALECRATLLNINYGHNQELLKKSKRLSDYAYFIYCVRNYLQQGMDLEQAIDAAVEDCIRDDILADILIKNRAEVKNMLLTTFNEKAYRKMLREEGLEEGLEKGREEGLEEGLEKGREEIRTLHSKLLADGRLADLEKALNDSAYEKQLLDEYHLK